MVFEIDQSSLPFVRTRPALLALDLQRDFASPDSPLAVKSPPNLVENVVHLVSNFRNSGNVIWVRTVFEASRPVNINANSESVITDAELPVAPPTMRAQSTADSRPPSKSVDKHKRPQESDAERFEDDEEDELAVDEEDQWSETFLTVAPGQNPRFGSPASAGSNLLNLVARHIDTQRDLVFQKTHYSAFRDGSLVKMLRGKLITELYICGAFTNISIYATALEAARHGYAITIVSDCVGYRSKARHDEALRKLEEFTGCNIISSIDLIKEIQEREKAQKAQMALPPPKFSVRPTGRGRGQGTADLGALLASLSMRPEAAILSRASASPGGAEKAVTAAFESNESLAPSEPDEEDVKLPQRTPSAEDNKDRVNSNVKSRKWPSKPAKDRNAITVTEASSSSAVAKSSLQVPNSSIPSQKPIRSSQPLKKNRSGVSAKLPDSSESRTIIEVDAQPKDNAQEKGKAEAPSDLNDHVEKMAELSLKAEPISLCEGDTTIIQDLFDEVAAEDIFERVRDEVRWQKMSHQGGEVPRLVAVQGEAGKDGSIPIYRHPADESPPLFQFSPIVSLIRETVEAKLGHPVNHVLIQFYRDGNDYISEHSDKTLDIVPNTYIANVSLGAQRTMVFRTKKQKVADGSGTTELVQPRQATRSPLPHNSMCRMGLVTNMRWLHAIRQDKRMVNEKTAEELAYSGGRISLTFRQIGTFLSKDQQKIWGQGAISKVKENARSVINGNAIESEKMIRAFGQENQASEFHWKAHYGEGFDVLHIENSPKLFLSGDKVADLRVKLMLTQYGIEWQEGALSPSFNWKNGCSARDAPPIPESLPVKFMDNDLSKSTITGDLAIMLYLDAVYGSASTEPQFGLARVFTLFQQTTELLKLWRAQKFSIKPFQKELGLWDALVVGDSFIAGDNISLADYALWPLLHEIRGEWDTFDGSKNLSAYYERLKKQSTFLKVLCPKGEAGSEDKELCKEQEDKLVALEVDGYKLEALEVDEEDTLGALEVDDEPSASEDEQMPLYGGNKPA